MNDPARILIADDEEGFAKTTALLLEGRGYRCDCAADGHEAEAMLDQADYDLLVADIRMRGNADLQLVRKIKERRHPLPVILVTAYPSIETALRSLDLPVYAYMIKPINHDLFMSKVGQAVKWNAAYRTVAESEERLADSITKLSEIHELMALSKEDRSEVSLHSFLAMTYGNVMAAVLDMGKLIEALHGGAQQDSICHVLNCPRVSAFEEAVRKAIETLRATKGDFKSKEIAALRRNLEALLESEGKRLQRT